MCENWMSNLPAELHNAPIVALAIPGSHDSCANALLTTHPVANDKSTIVRALGRFPIVRRLILRWATTQHLSVTEQLRQGIRYFDMRVSVPSCASLKGIRLLHALYGDDLQIVLAEVNEFLESHPRECVILDFNHFYNFSLSAYQDFLKMIERTFGIGKLCPQTDIATLSLQWMYANGFQVIAISAVERISPPSNNWIWLSSCIMSPFPNVSRLDRLFEFLNVTLRDHRKGPRNSLFVSQAILTASVKDICLHPNSSLEKIFSLKCTEKAVSWIDEFDDKSFFNIVICDFVEHKEFCDVVIALNFRHLEEADDDDD